MRAKVQHPECCAELLGLGTFLTLEELTQKDEGLLQQVHKALFPPE